MGASGTLHRHAAGSAEPWSATGSGIVASLLQAYPFSFSIDQDNLFGALGPFFQTRHPDLLHRPIASALTLLKPRVNGGLQAFIQKQRGRSEPDTRIEMLFAPPDRPCEPIPAQPPQPQTVRLAGAFLPCDHHGTRLFLGTIAASEMKNMTAHGLTIGDFGPIDPSPEFAMMAEVNAGMLADSQLMNEQLRRSRDEALAAKQELEKHRERLEETVRERTDTIERQAARLEEALQQEKHLSELQRGFVSMTSHEFRTPLAIIDGNARRIEHHVSEMSHDAVKDRIKRIRRAVVSMQSVMENTLAAAKMEAGKVRIEPRLIDVQAILKECCDAQRELSSRHCIALDMTDCPVRLMADPSSVAQIVTNLLSNAIKYSPEADRIDVRLRHREDAILISVQDYGLGIDEDDQRKMFTRFFRARTSAGIPGTGIGLNLAKMLAEEHGGSITIFSTKGEGSTFTLSLPLGSAPPGGQSA